MDRIEKFVRSAHKIREWILHRSRSLIGLPPLGGHCEHFELFPDIFNIASENAIFIINVIPNINLFKRLIAGDFKNTFRIFNDAQLRSRRFFYETKGHTMFLLNKCLKHIVILLLIMGLTLNGTFIKRGISCIIWC
jgi:hypothetical protein